MYFTSTITVFVKADNEFIVINDNENVRTTALTFYYEYLLLLEHKEWAEISKLDVQQTIIMLHLC